MNEKRQLENPLRTWRRQTLRNVLSNLRERIVFVFLDGLLVVFLFMWLSTTLQITKDSGLVNQLFVLGFFVFLLFFPFLYGWRSSLQISQELLLCASIFSARKEVDHIRRHQKDLNALQFKINKARRELKDFIEYSEVISPPVHSYELNRLHKGIDIFFNSTSEVLFSKPNAFSRKQSIEEQMTLDYYESLEHPTREELDEQFEEMQKEEMGVIDWFGIAELDEFLQYLGDNLFAWTEPFSPFSYKHPIDLITLSRFFEHWNSVVSSCKNCRNASEKSRQDIEKFYEVQGERETQRRQRAGKLTDNIMVVIVSVVLSVIVNYLMRAT